MEIPDLHILYLGGAAAPETTEGLKEVPPAQATAILFNGGFGYGSTGALAAALDAAPHVRLVAFDSPGGRPLVAQGIAELIRDRHLDTYVDRYCASACIAAFAAGTVRSSGPRAVFGFHRGASFILDDLANIMFLRMERQWFVRSGISLSFGNRALHAPNLQPYVPPLDELVAAGFINRVRGLTGRAPAIRGIGKGVFAEIFKLEPQTAATILLAERSRLAAGMAPERAQAIALDEAALVVDRWFSRSSDTAILAYADAMLAALAALDPVSCMRWQVGITDQDTGFLAIPAAQRTQLLAAGAAILHDANAFPIPLPTVSYAGADSAAQAEIAARFGSQALDFAATPEHAFDDPAKSCAVSISYLKALRNSDQAASVLRWALASG
jgi:hypothetical protein